MKNPDVTLRYELPEDHDAIAALIQEAFASAAHSSGTEASIVERLRDNGTLCVSVVAEHGGVLLGHCAISPVKIGGRECNWFGLGPVAVTPSHQGKGIGAALIERCLDDLAEAGAGGVVVLGDPAYYPRFGFRPHPDLSYADVPAEYFMALKLRGTWPSGSVDYDPAFS